MGFLPGSLDKSVFNQGTWASAVGPKGQNGYAVVRIQPNNSRLNLGNNGGGKDPAIKGVFDFDKGGFSFNVDANWEELGGIGGAVFPDTSSKVKKITDKLNPTVSLGGVANIGAGLASQLIYQKSGFLEIKVPLMIVDWEGTGQPILSSLLLSRYCLPSYITNIKDELESGLDQLKEWLNKLATNKDTNLLAKVTALATSLGIEGVEQLGEGGLKGAEWALDNVPTAKEIAENTQNNLGGPNAFDDAFTLRASPSDVTLEIGQFFKNPNMVITGVNFDFSKQMTTAGPLYVNIDITLKSRRILTSVDSIGLRLPSQENNRYKELDNTLNIT